MQIHVLIEEFKDGGSFLAAADMDAGTILDAKIKAEERASLNKKEKGTYRIATIGVTNKRLSIKPEDIPVIAPAGDLLQNLYLGVPGAREFSQNTENIPDQVE